jgi:tRNA dimethylallyltransferase
MEKENLPKLIIILGPTASGKTNLSLKLARWLRKEKKLFSLSGIEIISADSRQVYKEMDLGTGKITKKEMGTVPHYLLDIASPKRKFSVAQYQKKVFPLLEKIKDNNKIALLVGGSPFYIYSITEGWSFPQLKPDWSLRKKLEKKSCPDLLEILQKKDPRRAQEIEKTNKRRIIRAVEIARTYGEVPPLGKEKKFQTLFLGIKRNREELKKLIKKRLSKRFSQGMIKEVKRLKNQGLSWQRLESFGLEYRWIAKYLQDKIDYQIMIKKLQKDIEHFAKRQMTWFKKDKRIKWVKNFREAQRATKNFLEE